MGWAVVVGWAVAGSGGRAAEGGGTLASRQRLQAAQELPQGEASAATTSNSRRSSASGEARSAPALVTHRRSAVGTRAARCDEARSISTAPTAKFRSAWVREIVQRRPSSRVAAAGLRALGASSRQSCSSSISATRRQIARRAAAVTPASRRAGLHWAVEVAVASAAFGRMQLVVPTSLARRDQESTCWYGCRRLWSHAARSAMRASGWSLSQPSRSANQQGSAARLSMTRRSGASSACSDHC